MNEPKELTEFQFCVPFATIITKVPAELWRPVPVASWSRLHLVATQTHQDAQVCRGSSDTYRGASARKGQVWTVGAGWSASNTPGVRSAIILSNQ